MNLLLALVLSAQVPGSIELDPRLRWYTLETEHFAVHFPCTGVPDEAELALPRNLCAVAEDAHRRLVPVAGWEPQGRTNVVLADFFDYSNGWAAPFPANTITVLPSQPAGDRTNYDDWLATLFVHEYSHTLEIDQVRGPMAALRRVFGRLALPNALAPFWVHEGYAVYNETRVSRYGRNRGAEFRTMLNAAAQAQTLLLPDQCGNYELRRYPSGNAPYLYGGMFYDWLARTRDPAFADSLNSLRARSIPYTEAAALRRLTGRSLSRLWQDWQAELRPGRPLDSTATKRLTGDGFAKSGPVWSRSGSELFYVSNTGLEYPCIRAVDSTGRQSRVVCRAVVNGTLAVSPDGRQLCFGELRRLDNVYEFSDLVLVDITDGTKQRLTDRLRARDPDFAPDTDLVALVVDGNGRNRLCLLDLSTRELGTLLEPDEPTAFHSPRFSPSGRWLAVGVHRPGGLADIELVDLRTGWVTPLTEDCANDINPCWSRTGRFVYFASDRTGTYEVFAFEISTGRLYQCTSAGTGFFEPAVSPDNRSMAVSSLGAGGHDIAVLPIKASGWRELPRPAAAADAAPGTEVPICEARLYYYNPFPSVLPQFWCPLVTATPGLRLGAFTLGWDALQFHRYSIQAGYEHSMASPFLAGGYEYRGWWAKPSVAADITLESQSVQLLADLPILSFVDAHWLDIAYDLRHDSGLDARLSASWTWSNARTWRFAVAPSEGAVVGLAADYSSPAILARHKLVRGIGFLSLYFGAPRLSWSLRLRVAAGTASGDSTAATGAFRLGAGPGLLGVRGYAGPAVPARTVGSSGLQLRIPLWWVERGIGNLPVFVQNVNGAVFVDAATGSAAPWDPDVLGDNFRAGAGLELRSDLILGHLLPVQITFGAAAGLRPTGKLQLYGSVSSDLLAGLLLHPRSDPFDRLHLPDR